MFRPTLVTPPADLPVGIFECKQHAIVDHDEDDGLVDAYIGAATSYLDGFRGVLGRAIVTQTWKVELAAFQRTILLPVPDVQSVTITYSDDSGASQTWGDYRLSPVASGVDVQMAGDLPATAPENHAPVSVEFTCGFGGPDDVPWAIKVAIMQMVAHLYNNREGAPAPNAMLIAPYRWATV